MNLGLTRNLLFSQTRGLSIQLLASNVFNTVQFSAIDSIVNSPTFGQVTAVRPIAAGAAAVPIQVLMITTKKKPRSSLTSWFDRLTMSDVARPELVEARARPSCGFFHRRRLFSLSCCADLRGSRRRVFRSGTELVLVNVVVRDKSGAVVRGLTRERFQHLRGRQTADGDELRLRGTGRTFADRDVSASATHAGVILSSPSDAGRAKDSPERRVADAAPAAKVEHARRRLIVLFFDLSSMQPEGSPAGGEGGAQLRRFRSWRRRI